MDKKQVHKIGKMINKPVKFVKKNAGWIVTAVVSVGGTAIVNALTEKNRNQ
ncbi:hypothetical protein [Streptococcus devriesei]|uniref:hypothetical protein n=1 Tax=Streptococcus devriesei TaxID=231233 RepID=UPI00041A3EF6|nr:hypothetical protein [Streptococcus devriesei]